MDAPKLRPTVTITPYSASNSTYLRQQLQDGQKHKTMLEEEPHATKCEFSTNLFRNQIRRQFNSGLTGELLESHQTMLTSSNSNNNNNPKSRLSDLSQIRGPTGSVRGHKDVVRKSLEGIKVAYHNRFRNFSSSLTTSTATSSSASSASSSATDGGSSMLSFSTFFAGRHCSNAANGNNQAFQSLTSFSSNNKPPRLSSMTNSSLLMTIDNELFCSEYLERLAEDEQDLCVAYTTTLGVIRRTFEDSKMLRSILDLNLVRYEERDIYLNQEYKSQLRMRSSGGCSGNGSSLVVPALYVDGLLIGGVKEVEAMNESGELAKLLAKFKMSQAPREICHCCGNAKFIACQSCNGSRKSTIHHFKFNSVALRCIKCDNNDGLVQCPVCSVRSYHEQDMCEKPGSKVANDVEKVIEISHNKEAIIKTLTICDGANGIDKKTIDETLVDMNNNVEC